MKITLLREMLLNLNALMELEMNTFIIIALQLIVVGVTLVGMWYLLKDRDGFHSSEIRRHH